MPPPASLGRKIAAGVAAPQHGRVPSPLGLRCPPTPARRALAAGVSPRPAGRERRLDPDRVPRPEVRAAPRSRRVRRGRPGRRGLIARLAGWRGRRSTPGSTAAWRRTHRARCTRSRWPAGCPTEGQLDAALAQALVGELAGPSGSGPGSPRAARRGPADARRSPGRAASIRRSLARAPRFRLLGLVLCAVDALDRAAAESASTTARPAPARRDPRRATALRLLGIDDAVPTATRSSAPIAGSPGRCTRTCSPAPTKRGGEHSSAGSPS